MSTDAMEFLVVVLCGILIVSAVYELAKMLMRHAEDRREQHRRDAWNQRQERR